MSAKQLTVVEVATLVAASTNYAQAQATFSSICAQLGIDPAKTFQLSPEGELTQD